MMKLASVRLNDSGEDTIGALYVDGKMKCFTLEDEGRTEKVYGETRIPAGIYRLRAREYGRFFVRNSAKWTWHRGMIELVDVPGFTDILIHRGNSDDDTAGCILVADQAIYNELNPGEMNILSSTSAYRRLYEDIIEAVEKGEAEIEIIDSPVGITEEVKP